MILHHAEVMGQDVQSVNVLLNVYSYTVFVKLAWKQDHVCPQFSKGQANKHNSIPLWHICKAVKPQTLTLESVNV